MNIATKFIGKLEYFLLGIFSRKLSNNSHEFRKKIKPYKISENIITCDCSMGDITINLPNISTETSTGCKMKNTYTIKKVDNTKNKVIINPRQDGIAAHHGKCII